MYRRQVCMWSWHKFLVVLLSRHFDMSVIELGVEGLSCSMAEASLVWLGQVMTGSRQAFWLRDGKKL